MNRPLHRWTFFQKKHFSEVLSGLFLRQFDFCVAALHALENCRRSSTDPLNSKLTNVKVMQLKTSQPLFLELTN